MRVFPLREASALLPFPDGSCLVVHKGSDDYTRGYGPVASVITPGGVVEPRLGWGPNSVPESIDRLTRGGTEFVQYRGRTGWYQGWPALRAGQPVRRDYWSTKAGPVVGFAPGGVPVLDVPAGFRVGLRGVNRPAVHIFGGDVLLTMAHACHAAGGVIHRLCAGYTGSPLTRLSTQSCSVVLARYVFSPLVSGFTERTLFRLSRGTNTVLRPAVPWSLLRSRLAPLVLLQAPQHDLRVLLDTSGDDPTTVTPLPAHLRDLPGNFAALGGADFSAAAAAWVTAKGELAITTGAGARVMKLAPRRKIRCPRLSDDGATVWCADSSAVYQVDIE